jgi:hypothetical protein
VISVALPGRRLLQMMRRGTGNVGNLQVVKLAAQIEGCIVQAVIDDSAVKPDTPQQVEGVDHVGCQMDAGSGPSESFRQLVALD